MIRGQLARTGLDGSCRAFLLSGLLLGSAPAALAQSVAPPPASKPAAAAPAPVPAVGQTIKTLQVRGNERLEPATVLSYVDLRAGQPYDRETLDKALKALFETDLFADVKILDDGAGGITVEVRENPVINRVLIEGAKRVKEDKIREEIRVAPRQIFTRAKVRSDVDRILELYRRSGRFAARVEPKIIQLEQNRVDLVFEISEGPKSKIRQINILGNQEFSDGKLRDQMASRQARWYRFFSSSDTYDPDRLAYDQQKLRQFYLTEGYADFRVTSSIAELTPDRRDFIVTYVVEEGDRYKFGDVDLTSQLRDAKAEDFKRLVHIKRGDWYNAKLVEDTIDGLTNSLGLLGYAFADVRPRFDRDKDKREMNITFSINETPRVYVESVTVNGNTRTRDEVIRREFRLSEGDAFNSVKVSRSRDRIQSLGFFQDKLEVQQKPGSAADKVALQVDVEERPTGSLQVSAGYSSLEGLILSFSIEERNFRGRGQNLRLSTSISSWSKSIELGFTEPYLFDRNLALGVDLFRRDYSSWRWGTTNDRETTYKQVTTGFQVRLGTPITEYWSFMARYGLSFDDVTLDNIYFTNGQCDPIKAGRFLCDALGKYTTSSLGYTLAYNSLDNRLRPTRGQRLAISQDVAGLGGTVKYVRSRIEYDFYHNLGAGFILRVGGEAGNIFGYGGSRIRLTDRFFLGEPRMRGFRIRGVGPRIIRKYYDAEGNLSGKRDDWVDDALGGENYYLGHVEVEIPLGSGGRELGLRPSIFMDVGAVWDIPAPDYYSEKTSDGTNYFIEEYVGNSASPRISVGAGVSWNSPFGPFRFDVAKVVKKVEGDDTQVFQFNVGTQF